MVKVKRGAGKIISASGSLSPTSLTNFINLSESSSWLWDFQLTSMNTEKCLEYTKFIYTCSVTVQYGKRCLALINSNPTKENILSTKKDLLQTKVITFLYFHKKD